MENSVKKTSQLSLFLGPIAVITGLSLLWLYFIRPQAIQFIHRQIPQLNETQNFVQLSVTDIDISFLRLQLSAGYVEIKFKQNLAELKPVKVKRMRFQLDPFKLLVGQLSVSKIQVDQLDWAFENKKVAEGPALQELPLDAFFKLLPQIPIDQIVVYNSDVQFSDSKQSLFLAFKIAQLNLQNNKNSLRLSLRKLNIHPADPKQSHVSAELDLDTQLNYTKNNSFLEVSLFKLKSFDSVVQISGKLNKFKEVIKNPEGSIKIDSEIHFDDVRTVGLSLFPQKNRLPAVTGFLKTDGEITFKGLDNFNGQLSIQTKQVNVDHFKLGQAQVKAEIRRNQIFINQIELEHPSGLASLKQIEIEQKSPYNFKAQMNVKTFDLQKLFVSMGMTDIPAGFIAKGEAHCGGFLEPEFKINCNVESQLQDIWVKSDAKTKMHILKLKTAEVSGDVNLSSNGVDYKTKLKVGQSQGSSQGEVLFAEGFKISYESEKLSFKDVESLADLNFKGDLKIKGTTSGNASAGIIDADIVFTNAEIDQFKLGRLESKLKYEKAKLSFNQVIGLLEKSPYQGDVFFDFIKGQLIATLDFKDLYGEDILSAIREKFGIAFDLSGRGQAHIDLTGPFDFWRLKYNLKAQLKQGQIADESFDQLAVNLNATGTAIQFGEVFLKKNKSRLTLEGSINTIPVKPLFVLQVKAQPFSLEESDHMMRLAPNFTGQAWIEGQVRGEIENPELNFNFNAKQLSFENNEYPGSQGQVVIDRKNFKFNGQLFGRQIQSDLIWPWNASDAFSVRLQIRDLNPLMLLPLVSIPQPTSEFYSRLNADIDLKSNQRSLKTAEGLIKINDFMLQRGALYLRLNRPSSMTFKSGLNQMDPIELKGEANRLQINLLNSKNEETKLTIAGDVQLRQFQFLVPFAQSLSGRLQLDSQVLFHANDFELFGDGEMTDGLINLKGFPQAIENINTPIEFSKSKILLNDLTAQLGQSEITGQGQIDIRGHKQINVNLQASADNIELTFPDQITTAGKAELVFFGNWLPYTLKVNYKVNRGLIEKDFGQDSSSSKTTLRASPYLPPQQAELQIPSLLLDVLVDMTQGVIVKNRLLEGEASGRLNISGTPENPMIAGQVDIKQGSHLIFKDKPFDIQTATIKFPGGPEINPDIYITANSRVSDYDINLLVQGPSKNLLIKATSQPPLSEPDIFSLLALGMTSSKLDLSKTQQEQTGLEVLAAISNQSVINKKFQEKFGLTVQLAPTVDSTKNIAVPKVVVSKKIRKNVNASYTRPLTGDTQNQEWKLQYLFNPNKSLILNYQNVETNQQDQIRNSNTNDQGILGLDFEYKREWK